jgi:hypothetical protein
MPKGLRPITTYNVFQGVNYGGDSGAQTVTTSAAITSKAFDLRDVAQNAAFSIQYTNATSGGTLALTYTMCSTANGTFFTPTGGGTIVSGLSSGTGGLSLEPEPFPFIKIVATATTQTCVCTVFFNIQ